MVCLLKSPTLCVPLLTPAAGNTCFCGYTFNRNPALLNNPSGSGDIPCTGDPTEYCGGQNKVQVYAVNSAASNSLPVSSTQPSATASSTASPTVVPQSGNYVNQGVFDDSPDSPLLTGDSQVSPDGNSVDYCAAYCSALVYSYFGVTDGTWSNRCHRDVMSLLIVFACREHLPLRKYFQQEAFWFE